jgi:hypothetical protein
MKDKEFIINKNYQGMTFLDTLLLIFIVLKCCELINWSWWIVCIPLWIKLGMIAIAIIIVLLGKLIKR